jgi:hypothetical protein
MKISNWVLAAAALGIAYYIYKKPKPINIDPPLQQPLPSESETGRSITLNLNNTRQRPSGLFNESMYKDYNASKSATVAPNRTSIFNNGI